MSGFGDLEQRDLTDHWPDEEADFTPWLAENVDHLEDVLGLNLEVVDTERWVGKYRLDLLARDEDTDREVVVENQLRSSDHAHLGKSIAYASGVEGDVVVWVAESFDDEHVDAVQWLNDNTREGVDFFAIRLEVWQIGDSPPAVKLNPIEEPSAWKDSLKQSDELTETQALRLEFWTTVRNEIQAQQTPLSARKPSKSSWYGQPVGTQDVKMRFWLHVRDDWIDTRIVVKDDAIYDSLEAERETIDDELGQAAEWLPPDEERKDGIVMVKRDADLGDDERWVEYVDWFLEMGERFRDVFASRVS
ncbi:DUF4268 domain-containing protein [Natronorubrum daqingense]|uniref:DUF4268 domain-containing protein n=1 Tax=Natronorubrum daqingense TaxID=588898 RepID=A0A1N7E6C8_9EURY|nr:DUF4268 domain-containing protein [Natronorubrum daqingense]APX96385.1 hypothetical protein BB347_07005 [Natronorubrum daqingense]SIR83589.1 protein of unknown function [Natronorubrum daqingense]